MTTKTNTPVLLVAISGIVLLEIVALLKGIDGILLTSVIGIIALMAGVVIPTPQFLKK